jgi:hypothetical protein
VAEGAAATERIRVAADATASPELRGVLTALADPADEDLERQLARLR